VLAGLVAVLAEAVSPGATDNVVLGCAWAFLTFV
jgi:hypothetical protein